MFRLFRVNSYFDFVEIDSAQDEFDSSGWIFPGLLEGVKHLRMTRTDVCFGLSEELNNDLADVLVGREVQVEVDGVVDAAHDGRLDGDDKVQF